MKTVTVESLESVSIDNVAFGNVCEASRNSQEEAAEIFKQLHSLVNAKVQTAKDDVAKEAEKKAAEFKAHNDSEIAALNEEIEISKARCAEIAGKLDALLSENKNLREKLESAPAEHGN